MEVIIVVAFVLFAFTHFDTVIALIAFCADQEYGSSEVFLGHYLGFAIGLLLAVIGGLLFNELLHSWVHLLGIIPLTLGVLSILHRLPETNLIHRRASGYGGRIGVVAATGIGLSGENLAVLSRSSPHSVCWRSSLFSSSTLSVVVYCISLRRLSCDTRSALCISLGSIDGWSQSFSSLPVSSLWDPVFWDENGEPNRYSHGRPRCTDDYVYQKRVLRHVICCRNIREVDYTNGWSLTERTSLYDPGQSTSIRSPICTTSIVRGYANELACS